jgi:putative redox protein
MATLNGNNNFDYSFDTMTATLTFDAAHNLPMQLVGINEHGKQTLFDTKPDHGGNGSAASPMEVLMQATAACSTMDVLTILRKKRKTVTALRVEMEGDRAEEHPKRFLRMKFTFILTSPDAVLEDLKRSVELSETTYCSAAAMARLSGCALEFDCKLIRP